MCQHFATSYVKRVDDAPAKGGTPAKGDDLGAFMEKSRPGYAGPQTSCEYCVSEVR